MKIRASSTGGAGSGEGARYLDPEGIVILFSGKGREDVEVAVLLMQMGRVQNPPHLDLPPRAQP